MICLYRVNTALQLVIQILYKTIIIVYFICNIHFIFPSRLSWSLCIPRMSVKYVSYDKTVNNEVSMQAFGHDLQVLFEFLLIKCGNLS